MTKKVNGQKEKKALKIAAVIIVVAIVATACVLIARKINNNYNTLDYDKYIKLAEYKGLTYEESTEKITDKDVEEEIQSRLLALATPKNINKGKVEDGDTVIIDFVGKINGEEFDGGYDNDFELQIGSGEFIDGFESGLIGKKVGDTVELNLTFPDDYKDPDVAGKDVVFTVTIKSKVEYDTPEYDEKFIKENSDYDNKKDYEASVKKELEESLENEQIDETKETLWEQVQSGSEVIKYPKELYEKELDRVYDYFEETATEYGMEFKDFQEQYDITDKQMKEYARESVKASLSTYSIADKENLKITDKEYREALEKLLTDAGLTEDTFKEQYGQTIQEYGKESDYRTMLLMQKVKDFIYENATPTKATEKDKEDKE